MFNKDDSLIETISDMMQNLLLRLNMLALYKCVCVYIYICIL